MRRRTVVVLAAAGLVVAMPLGAYAYLVLTTRDAPDPASLGAAEDESAAGVGSLAGTWTVADVDGNFVGYRVRERLGPIAAPSDAVGRTSRIEGAATIDVAVGDEAELTRLDLTVDVASLDSGTPRRDEFVRRDALEVAEHPTAEFHLDEPVEIGAPDRSEVVELAVPGRLTLHGVTDDVSFDVQARWNGATIQVAGTTEIRRSSFGIDVSSQAGFNIEEAGTVEFELTFTPAGVEVGTPPPTLLDSSLTPTEEGELRLPCRSDDPPLVLDPPVLVAGGTEHSLAFEIVAGSGQPTPLHPVGGLSGGMSWSPDWQEIVFSASAAPEQPRELFIVPAAGGEPVRIPGIQGAVQPEWGRDGRILFVQENGPTSDIWIVDRDGTDARPLVDTAGRDSDPRSSPDGSTIAFTTAAGAGNQDVVLSRRSDMVLRTVAGGPGYEYSPSFHPTRDELLFVRDGAIFAVGFDGEEERQLTSGPSDVGPEWSPDGRQLVFSREGSLFVADADGSDPRCVELPHTMASAPRWRP